MKRVSIFGIYCFIHRPDGRCYIGSAKDIKGRKIGHLRTVGKEKKRYFHQMIEKLGIENFDFEIIQECNESNRLPLEEFYIAFYDSCYPRGFNMIRYPTRGFNYQFSPEAIARLSDVMKGKQHALGSVRTEDHKKSISMAQKGNKNCLGKKLSPERCAAISAFHTGRKRKPETCAKISASQKGKNKGKKLSIEHRAAISRGGKGKKRTPEQCAAISARQIGKSTTENHRANLRAAWVIRKARKSQSNGQKNLFQ